MALGAKTIPAAAGADATSAVAACAARAAAEQAWRRRGREFGVGAAAWSRMFSVVSRIHFINSRTRMQSLLHATDLLPPLLLQPAPCRSPLLAYQHRWRTRRQRSRSKFHPHPLPLPLPPIAPLAAVAAGNLRALASPALAAATGQQPLQPEVLPHLVVRPLLPQQQQSATEDVQQQQHHEFFSVPCGVGAAGESGQLAALPPPLLVAPEHLLGLARTALQAELDEAVAVAAAGHPFGTSAAAARFSAAAAASQFFPAGAAPSFSTAAAHGAADRSASAAAQCAEEVAAAAAAAAQGGSRSFWHALLQRIQEVRDLLPIDTLVKLLAIVTTRFSPQFLPLCSPLLRPLEDAQHAAAGLVKLLLPQTEDLSYSSSTAETAASAAAEAEAAAAAASPSAALLLPCMRPIPPPLLLACSRDLLEDLPLLSPPAAAAVAAVFASSNCCSSTLAFALIERWRWNPAAAAALAVADTPAAAAGSAVAAELLEEEHQGAGAWPSSSTSSDSTRSSAAAAAGQQQQIQQQLQRNGIAAAAAAPNRHADLNAFSASDFSVFISSLSHVLLQRQEVVQRQQRQLRHRRPPPPPRSLSAPRPLLPGSTRTTQPQQRLQQRQQDSAKQQQGRGRRTAAEGPPRGPVAFMAGERGGLLAAPFFRDCCCFLHAKRNEFTLRSFAAAVAALAAALPHKTLAAGATSLLQGNLQSKQQERPPERHQQTQQPVKNSPSLASVRLLLLTADAFLTELHAQGGLPAAAEQPPHTDRSSSGGTGSSDGRSNSRIAEVVATAAHAEELLTAARLLHALAVARRYLHAYEPSAVGDRKEAGAAAAEAAAGSAVAAAAATVDVAGTSRLESAAATDARKRAASSDTAAAAAVNEQPGAAGCALLAARIPQLLLQQHQQLPLLPLPADTAHLLQRPHCLSKPQQHPPAEKEGFPPASAGPASPQAAAASGTATQLIDQAAVQLRNQLLAAAGLAAAATVIMSTLTWFVLLYHERTSKRSLRLLPLQEGARSQPLRETPAAAAAELLWGVKCVLLQPACFAAAEQQQQEHQRSHAKAQVQKTTEALQQALCELLRARGALGMQTEHLVDCVELLATSKEVTFFREASNLQKKTGRGLAGASRLAAGSAAAETNRKPQLSLFSAPETVDAEQQPFLCAAFQALAAELVRRYAALSIADKARLKYIVKRLQWEDPFLKHCLGSYTVAIARWRPPDSAEVPAVDWPGAAAPPSMAATAAA